MFYAVGMDPLVLRKVLIVSKVFLTGLGQDSHRFLLEKGSKPCIVAGILFEKEPGLDADSDGDVVFHAITNAITAITHVPILGHIAIDLCKEGITDSAIYLEKALETLKEYTINHIALSIEGKRPKFQNRSIKMRESVAKQLHLRIDQVGMTFTSGDGLTSFGKGEGLSCFALISVSKDF